MATTWPTLLLVQLSHCRHGTSDALTFHRSSARCTRRRPFAPLWHWRGSRFTFDATCWGCWCCRRVLEAACGCGASAASDSAGRARRLCCCLGCALGLATGLCRPRSCCSALATSCTWTSSLYLWNEGRGSTTDDCEAHALRSILLTLAPAPVEQPRWGELCVIRIRVHRDLDHLRRSTHGQDWGYGVTGHMSRTYITQTAVNVT